MLIDAKIVTIIFRLFSACFRTAATRSQSPQSVRESCYIPAVKGRIDRFSDELQLALLDSEVMKLVIGGASAHNQAEFDEIRSEVSRRVHGIKGDTFNELIVDYARNLLVQPCAAKFEHELGYCKDSAIQKVAQDYMASNLASVAWEKGGYRSFELYTNGVYYSGLQQWETASKYFLASARIAEDTKRLARSLREWAVMIFNLGDWELAETILSTSRQLALNYSELSDVLEGSETMLAWIEMYRGRVEHARTIFEKYDSKFWVGRTLMEQGDYKRALQLFKADRDMIEMRKFFMCDFSYRQAVGFNLQRQARANMALGEFVTVESQLSECRELFSGSPQSAHVLHESGNQSLMFGNSSKAIKHYSDALEIWKKHNYAKGQADNALRLAEAMLRLKDTRGALKALETVSSLSNKMGKNVVEMKAQRLRMKIKSRSPKTGNIPVQ